MIKTVFFHVPKTGGKTMYALLRNWYGEKRCRYISIPECGRAREIIEGTDFDCYFGAFGFQLMRRARYMCLLRHPVKRVVSYYQWLKGKDPKRHPGAKHATGTLLNFVQSRWHRIENNQVAMLAGYGQDPPHRVGRLDLAEAMRNLRSIDHLGTTKNFRHYVTGLGLVEVDGDIPRHNKTEWDEYPEEWLQLISDRNLYDWELYRRAQRLGA